MKKNIKLLNGTVDVALRLLAVLSTCKILMSEDRLAIYSYFALNTSHTLHGPYEPDELLALILNHRYVIGSLTTVNWPTGL